MSGVGSGEDTLRRGCGQLPSSHGSGTAGAEVVPVPRESLIVLYCFEVLISVVSMLINALGDSLNYRGEQEKLVTMAGMGRGRGWER